jgi:transcriptional regulator with PAS, ATPase and Fis domain
MDKAVAMMCIGEDLTEKRRLEKKLKETENRYKMLASRIESEAGLARLIGKSPAIKEIKQVVASVAETDVTVLLTGETGTGKELVASLIHEKSLHKHKPLIRVNCASLSESLLESELFGHEKGAFTGAIRQKKGRFEIAHGGTIFLDEIGEISPRMQVAILRFLEKGEVQRVGGEETLTLDVRIIAATNRDLEKAIADGMFRKDLFYRLNILPIRIPPLNERKEDILLLINHFIGHFKKKYHKKINTLSPETVRILVDYRWPGNVRELENIIERLVVTAQKGTIYFRDVEKALLPTRENESISAFEDSDTSLKSLVKHFERKVIEAVLREEGDNSSRAARRLKISRSSLYGKLK